MAFDEGFTSYIPQCPESPESHAHSEEPPRPSSNTIENQTHTHASVGTEKDEQHYTVQANELLRQRPTPSDTQDYYIPLIGYTTGIKIDTSNQDNKSFYAKTAYVGGLRQDWKQSKGYGSVFNRLNQYR